jgi:hypothetical protein
MASPLVKITVCPSMPASGYSPHEPVFGDRGRKPVSIQFGADGEIKGLGFDFSDYSRARTVIHKLNYGRKKPAPSWLPIGVNSVSYSRDFASAALVSSFR